MKTTLLVLFTLAAALCADDLLPDLAPLAKKFDEDSAALAAQRAAAVPPLKQQYLAVIDAAEKAARAKVQVAVVAALFAEREAVMTDTMSPAVPADLPKNLEPARKIYLDALAKLALDHAGRQQRLDAAYLSRLDFLPGKTKPALAAQIAAEKERVISTATAVNAGGAHSNNLLVNSSFSQKDGDDLPTGWKAFKNKGSVQMENGNPFYRQSDYHIHQSMLIPRNSYEARVRLRMRTADGAECGYRITCLMADGSSELVFGSSYPEVPNKWKTFTERGKIPKGAVSLLFDIHAYKGTGDFDDVVLEVK